MSITETIKRRIGRPPVPVGPDLAPSVQAKIDDATARLRALQTEIPSASLDAVTEQEGAGDRLARLQSQLAVVDAELATLRHALGQAEQVDKRKWQQQKAAIHRSAWLAVKKHLEARDAAAQTMSVAIENAVQAFRDMIEAADKAMRAGAPLASQNLQTSGHKLAVSEIYRATATELRRLGEEWPKQPNSPAAFPTDRQAGIPLRSDIQVPLADELRRHSADLLAELDGSEVPKFDQ
jgi:hypothetical protein